MIQFAQPQYLWLLTIVPIFIALLWYGLIRSKRQRKAFADPTMHELLAPEASVKRKIWRAAFRIGAIIMLIFALARPQMTVNTPVADQRSIGVDVAFCFDVSNSMWAQDVRPDRLSFAKQIATYTLQQLEGSRTAIVVFAGGAYIRLPLTSDLPTARTFLDDIQPGMVSHQGTNIAQAIERSAQTLSAPSEAGKAVIILTDGEDHEGGIEEAIKKLQDQKIKAFVVTIGSEEGAMIPIEGAFLTDSLGQEVVSRPNSKITAEIATRTGGESLVGSSPRAIGDKLLEQLRSLPQARLNGEGASVQELFALPLLAAIALLLLSIAVMQRKSRLFGRIKLFDRS